MTTENPVGIFLKKHKLAWDYELGEEHTDEEFSAYLGVGLGTYNKWKSGIRTPTGLYIEQIASRLGDEIYTVLGLEAPKRDKRLRDIANIWGKIPNDIQDELWRTAMQHREQSNEAGTNTSEVVKPTRKRTH